MKLISTYSVKIKDHNKIFNDSVQIYQKAVGFYIDVCLAEWDTLTTIESTKGQMTFLETISVVTAKHDAIKYDFGKDFYKFPCYLRRAAINEALGMVSSYKSNHAIWENSDPRIRDSEPSRPKVGHCYPVLYRYNMFVRKDDLVAQIKVFRNNTWDWITVQLRKTDVDYITHHCSNMKECAPVLHKRGKQWFLDFAFKKIVTLKDRSVWEQTIVAVDLGLNNACTCSVMRYDGTVLGRRFLKLPKEYDSLKRCIDHIKHAQHHGSRKMPVLWAYARGVNDNIAVKTATFIIETAVMYDADVVVMEHLDLQGKKHGSKKQHLALWRAQYVQDMVAHKAHSRGMHISTVCAWGTSRLAFDGSGRVLRGKESKRTKDSYSICEFQTGKIYNCDLNASYNIGARYFVRELVKTIPATEWQQTAAKVPAAAKRSTCTLATLISLCGELYPAGYSHVSLATQTLSGVRQSVS
jgi:IS605 OrfB family transposase